MPPPITSRLGGRSSSSAPVESITRGSSGRPGSRTDSDPAAMMHCWKLTTCPAPPSSILSSCGDAKVAVPCTTVTLRCRARFFSPPVRRPTTESFHSRSLPASICGAPKRMPCSAIACASSMTRAACSSAFDGMQPTFRQTPPSVGDRSIECDAQAEVRGTECSGVPPGPGTEHDQVEVVGMRTGRRACRRRRARQHAPRSVACAARRPSACSGTVSR